jgi:hypothetical protein
MSYNQVPERVFQKLVELWDVDLDSNNPSSKELSRNMEDLRDEIQNVVQDYIQGSCLDEDTRLNLEERHFSTDFLATSRRMFGIREAGEIIDCLSDLGKMIHLRKADFLRSFIAAAITESIFRGWVSEFDIKSFRSDIVEKRLQESKALTRSCPQRTCH